VDVAVGEGVGVAVGLSVGVAVGVAVGAVVGVAVSWGGTAVAGAGSTVGVKVGRIWAADLGVRVGDPLCAGPLSDGASPHPTSMVANRSRIKSIPRPEKLPEMEPKKSDF